MKPIEMDLLNGERLQCDSCGEWPKNGPVWIYLDDDGDLCELVCEECHEMEKNEVNG